MRLLLLAIGASAFEQWAYTNDCGVAFMTQEPSHHYERFLCMHLNAGY